LQAPAQGPAGRFPSDLVVALRVVNAYRQGAIRRGHGDGDGAGSGGEQRRRQTEAAQAEELMLQHRK